jgi:hypothetical protein
VAAVELTGGIAGDDQVVDLGQALVGELRGRDALWTVPGTGERDEKRRPVFGKPLAGVGDDVGGRDGFNAPLKIPAQGGGEDLPGERRRAGAGQDNAQVRSLEKGTKECLRLLAAGQTGGAHLSPQVRLLEDLSDGVGGTQPIELLKGEANRGSNHNELLSEGLQAWV